MLNDEKEKKVGLAFFLYFMVLMEVVAWDMAVSCKFEKSYQR